MKYVLIHANGKGASFIELIFTALIVSIVAAVAISNYSSYRLRAERGNGKACLIDLARKQEGYFSRNNTYTSDLKALGYGAANAANCTHTTQYLLTVSAADADTCPLTRCYQLNAIPQGTQTSDGSLHLTYDASQPDPNRRLKKERGALGSGSPWD